MKRRGFLRLIGVGVMVTLLLSVFLPVSSAFAASLSLDPTSGMIGDRVYVDGTGFPASNSSANPPVYSYVDLYFTSVTTSGSAPTTSSVIDDQITTYQRVGSSVEVDDNGGFSIHFDVPTRLRDGSSDADVRGGTYYVCAVYSDSSTPRVRAVKAFTVIAGEITDFSPTKGPVGTLVDVAGDNFAGSENITVKLDDSDITDSVSSGDAKSTSSGKVSFTLTIPPATAGKHTITISDQSMSEVQESFTVQPALSVSPIKGPPGDSVTASGTGFGDRKEVTVTLNGQSVNTATTGRDGSFSIAFDVPDITDGTYKLEASDAGGNKADTDFTVEIGTQIAVSPETTAAAPGHVGQSVTISGQAFKPNTQVTITYASEPQVVGTTPTDAKGAFSYTFKVPRSPAGAHTISASDGTNSLQMPFYIESNPPAVPQPLLPEIGSKAPAMAQFDWGDVSDDSGVTYTLQVATSESFDVNTIVLEEKGLTTSGYTLSKEESLPSRSAKAPYYWRVRAIDGAGNEGDWTGANDFTVGISLPPWTVHLFWGLGVIGAIFFGYFLGKRRGYY